MNATHSQPQSAALTADIVDTLLPADLNDLCDATDAAIEGKGGFGWITPPSREILERYWKGALAVPERHLLVIRLDGVIAGAAQLVEPSRHNEAQAFQANLLAFFIAPWARGKGAGRLLIETAEKLAVEMGYSVMHLDVRETQEAALHLFQSMGYERWGICPTYARVEGSMIRGFYYTKSLRDMPPA